jgi:hypothetical protein
MSEGLPTTTAEDAATAPVVVGTVLDERRPELVS